MVPRLNRDGTPAHAPVPVRDTTHPRFASPAPALGWDTVTVQVLRPKEADAVASLRARIGRASALHRQAAATVAAAATGLDAALPTAADPRVQYDLAARLRAAADVLAPGWAGQSLDLLATTVPPSGEGLPAFVRIGIAQPLDDASFPVVVPLLGTGHLALDVDAVDTRVADLLRALLVRLLAAAPAGSLLVRAVDAGEGTTFAGFAPLADAGLMPPPASGQRGLRATLTEAEQWVRPAAWPGGPRRGRDRNLLLVIASLPQPLDAVDVARIALLAEQGPTAGLHMVVAGWPPRSGETQPPPLAHATRVTVRHPYASVSDPFDGEFAADAAAAGLAAPVFLDDDPPHKLVARLSNDLAARCAATSALRLADLLAADDADRADPAEGLAVTVGFDGGTPVTLRFNDLTPHWMVGGRAGSGKAAFLGNVLYGLCARYPPGNLDVYLIDFDGSSFLEFAPTELEYSWLPQIRAVGVDVDREYGLAVLRDLDDEMADRAAAAGSGHGRIRYPDLRRAEPLPRILCMIDEFPALLTGNDDVAAEAASRLESLARNGRSYGIHLVLASQGLPGNEESYAVRDPIFGHFPVRVALAGGGAVLDPANDAAAGLPSGAAVVNTAGGFGGPRGAIRGHERTVRFPDPYADPSMLADLRHRLRTAERAA
jgi:DNA segregation ATPase FtsK/SpoIIIE, S-DNA-T family